MGETHVGISGVPPGPVFHPVLLDSFFPQNFGMEILIPPTGAPKRGDGLGQHPVVATFGGSTHHPAGKAIPCGYGGQKKFSGENPSFPEVGLAPAPRGWARDPMGHWGLTVVPVLLQGLGCLGRHRPPAQQGVVTRHDIPVSHLVIKGCGQAEQEGPRVDAGVDPALGAPHPPPCNKGFLKTDPPKPPPERGGYEKRMNQLIKAIFMDV